MLEYILEEAEIHIDQMEKLSKSSRDFMDRKEHNKARLNMLIRMREANKITGKRIDHIIINLEKLDAQ